MTITNIPGTCYHLFILACMLVCRRTAVASSRTTYCCRARGIRNTRYLVPGHIFGDFRGEKIAAFFQVMPPPFYSNAVVQKMNATNYLLRRGTRCIHAGSSDTFDLFEVVADTPLPGDSIQAIVHGVRPSLTHTGYVGWAGSGSGHFVGWRCAGLGCAPTSSPPSCL